MEHSTRSSSSSDGSLDTFADWLEDDLLCTGFRDSYISITATTHNTSSCLLSSTGSLILSSVVEACFRKDGLGAQWRNDAHSDPQTKNVTQLMQS